MSDLFLYGTLCHPPLLRLVMGGDPVDSHDATLPDHEVRWVKDGTYPAISMVRGATTSGLLLQNLTLNQMARLAFYEEMFGYELRAIHVDLHGEPTPSHAFFPADLPELAADWSLSQWVEQVWPITRHAAAEVMSYFGTLSIDTVASRWGMIQTRAASKARAEAQKIPTSLRADFGRDQVRLVRQNRSHAGFFTLETGEYAFQKFDGRMSDVVEREGFIGGDAAIVLPYDPKRDLVMVIEQFRFGPYLRGDTHPWVLEPIAGRIDAGESPEDSARREAWEEAGLRLDTLEHVSDYYPSPGTNTEFVYTYVGLTDLDTDMEGVGGLLDEAEDIRAHVISFDRLMQLVSSGEASVGPLVLLALWIAQNRSRLRAQA